MKILMLRSGNDAAMVLATHVFQNYDEFIKKMNEKATMLGMKNTVFENPHGLDEETKNYSTAYDMAILSRYAFLNSIYQKIVSTKKYTCKSNLKSYVWYNRMSLLNQYNKCLGGKNGYTPQAGKTLVSYASNHSLRLLIVSLDDSNIYDHHSSLYEQYFNIYKRYEIVAKNRFYVDPSITNKHLYLKDSFYYPLTSDEVEKVSTMIHIFQDGDESSLKAGKIEIKLRDVIIGEIDIYETKSQKKKPLGFFQKINRIIDWIIGRSL